MSRELTRREFMVAAGGAAGLALLPGAREASARPLGAPEGPVVLFQGDSITDAGRNRNQPAAQPNHAGALGNGYPLLVASAALKGHPDRGLRFFNRGISGNKIPDLQARWEADTVALKPDILSILIGVNDYWHTLSGRYAGTVQDYETGYAALLQGTRQALPGTRVLVLEPFVLRTGAVTDAWFPAFNERRAAAARVAKQARVVWVPLQERFDKLAARTGPEYWAADGVHPTPAGHAVIADAWREAAKL